MSNSEMNTSFVGPSKPALAVLFLLVFLDNLGYAIVVPYLYFYVDSLGGSAFLYGVLLASYSLMSFVFTPIVSRLSDRYGRRKILLIALLISTVAYFIFGSAQAIWLLFLGRMLSGTTGATVPVAQAYVADVTTPTQRLRYLGLLGAAAGIAFILGPAIGGTLSSLFNYAVPSYLASFLALVNLVSAYFVLPEPKSFGVNRTILPFSALLKVIKTRKIALLLAFYFLFFMSFILLQSTLSPWLQLVFGFGSFETGLVFFLIGGISAFTQAVLLPFFIKKFSQFYWTVFSIGVFAAGLMFLSVSGNLFSFLAILSLVAFGFGNQYVIINTLISTSTPREAQGGTLGVAWSIAGLAQTISPVLAASLFSFGVTNGFENLVFVISALIAFLTLPLFFSFRNYDSNSK